jgi:hypothetical protein
VFGDNRLDTGTTLQTMGVQTTTTMIDQLRLVESTEEGILFDGLDGQVTVLPRSARRNHAVTMALDITAKHLAPPIEPTYDWLLLKNDVSVSNSTGTGIRLISGGSLSPMRVGSYADSVTISAPDNDLFNHANFRLAMGTLREERLPQLTLALHAFPSLIDTWCDVDVGSRITVAHPPAQMDPTPLDMLVEGYTEILDGPTWLAYPNLSPSTAWDAFTVGATANLGRLDTHGSRLVASYTSGATTMRIGVSANPYGKAGAIGWSSSGVPYDLLIAGERVTCTAMSSVTPAFVAVGTAAHADNASVVPGMPASIQNGDLLLVLAAIRNTAGIAGNVFNPGGWTILGNLGGNVVLLGQYWDGSFTAPTCAFTGGAAGDTCSAQIAAFRGVQTVLVASSVVQTNGVVQDIAVPSIYVPRDRCMTVTCGWKQDDYTSAATVPFQTEIAEASTVVGNDQSLTWDYAYLASATTPGATSFVITGGATAISKSFVVALAGDVYEATLTRSVNGVVKPQTAGASVSLWRPGRAAR